jgi:hypothetical protein
MPMCKYRCAALLPVREQVSAAERPSTWAAANLVYRIGQAADFAEE